MLPILVGSSVWILLDCFYALLYVTDILLVILRLAWLPPTWKISIFLATAGNVFVSKFVLCVSYMV